MSDSTPHPSELRAKAAFEAFPPEFQRMVRDDGDEIGQQVLAHLVQVLIGVPGGQAPAKDANHASGVMVHALNRILFFTAQHVVQGFRDRHSDNPLVVFQVGNVSFDPEPRILYESDSQDIAVLDMNLSDIERVPALTWVHADWPPESPQVGEFVAFAGFPIEYRQNGEPGSVDLAGVGGIMQVTSVTENGFKCVMERERLILTRGEQVPPPGSRLWGMSGGPVFRLVDRKPVLVGIVTDFGPDFEVFMMAPLRLASIPLRGA